MTARPIIFATPMVRALLAGGKTQTRRLATIISHSRIGQTASASIWHHVRSGDRLWVRESWHPGQAVADYENRFRAAVHSISYRASWELGPTLFGWRSPIHMPRAASRLTLTVAASRIERLQAITDADALAEGVPADLMDDKGIVHRNFRPVALMNFIRLWDTLHRAGAWDANPEIVVITFKVAARNIDQMIAA